MNVFLIAVILGIIEGLTEFLPVSSTGHLILTNQFFSFSSDFANTFDIVIQLGAILSVVVYFWKKINPWQKNINSIDRANIYNLWYKTIIAVMPALVIGAILGSKIKEYLFNPLTVAIMLVVGGIFLIFIENRKRLPSFSSLEEMSYKTAFLIGIFQCVAMIPGTSRSAATIIGAMLIGASRAVAAEFSFFLAIPTMTAASGYELLKHGASMSLADVQILALGFFVSFVVALAVIALFMSYIRKKDFKPFGYYRIILGIVVLVSYFYHPY